MNSFLVIYWIATDLINLFNNSLLPRNNRILFQNRYFLYQFWHYLANCDIIII